MVGFVRCLFVEHIGDTDKAGEKFHGVSEKLLF